MRVAHPAGALAEPDTCQALDAHTLLASANTVAR